MSTTFDQIRQLVIQQDVRISSHGYDELSADNLTVREVVAGVAKAILIEDYPDYPKGPSVLLLQHDRARQAIHVVWGIPKGYTKPAVLVTAYRPDLEKWETDLIRRRK